MYPQSQGYPQAGYPQPGYPQPGYPQQQGYPPQGGYPPPGGYPPAGAYAQPPRNPSVAVHIDPNASAGWGADSGAFGDKVIRNAFVSKVYSILFVQLAFTTLLIGTFVFSPALKAYFRTNQVWLFLGMIVFFVTYLILVCVESARRSYPTNFILLAMLTLGMGFEAAVISCRYSTDIVLYAAFTCAVSTLLITLLAKHSSFDMTQCGTVLCILSLVHMVVGMVLCIVAIATGYGRLASLLMAIFGAFLVMCYLMYDTQLIMGGRKHELSAEEYILGAILLYVDIVQMFLFLLEIFQRMSDD